MLPKIEISLEENSVIIKRENHQRKYELSCLIGREDIRFRIYQPAKEYEEWYQKCKNESEELLSKLESSLSVPPLCSSESNNKMFLREIHHNLKESICALELIESLREIRDLLPKPKVETISYSDS